MERIDARQLHGRPRPTPRILQFGGGNFMRGFMDWKIDRMNEQAGTDWGIVILRSVGGREGSALNDQDGIYTVVSRGIDASGNAASEARVIAAVRGEIDCNADWNRVLDLAARPEIRVILSNTTETGIVFDPAARQDSAPPASFPAKLTALLLHRWQVLGPAARGWHVIPCELTDRSGDALAALVRDHARQWQLAAGFADWLDREVVFFNTLVDRIVTGAPRADRDEIEASFGYSDPCLTTSELYHFLAIEQRPNQPKPMLALAEHDSGTVVVPDVTPLKLRKVAILNGAHTALCPLALLGGVATVGEAMAMPQVRVFLDRLLDTEVLPWLDLPSASKQEFAAETLRRFSNPYVHHQWRDISLNSISKIRARNLDRMQAGLEATGNAPHGLTLSLAAWCLFYLGRFPGAADLTPRDTPEVLALFGSMQAISEPHELARTILGETGLWGRRMDMPVLCAALASQMRALGNALEQGADLPALLQLQDRDA